MPDTGPSRLLSLHTPSVLDLRAGQVEAIFAASVSDPDGVQQVTVYYDRPLATEVGAYSFQIIHGYGSDWADGHHSYTAQVLPHNIGGTLNITHVEVTDNLGNNTTIPATRLQALGVDTSITIRSTNPDTTAPQLTSLDLPDQVDLSSGDVMAQFMATGTDANPITEFAIFFDREISFSFSSFSYSLVAFSGSEWDNGVATALREITSVNHSGTVDVSHVQITDAYGNSRSYTNEQLRQLGFETSFELVGTATPTPATYVANFPDTITIREGQTANLALNFVGMTNHWVSYSYHTSAAGGTADATDIGAGAGSGYISVASTFPTTRQQSFTISTARDGVQESTETAYLVIELNGNMTFPDGGRVQVVEIRIVDDNLTTGGAGRNVLYGTSGIDTLTGGGGNDIYHVTSRDRIVEAFDAGIDTVHSGFTRGLEANVENLTLTGTAALHGTGNTLANLINGNAGNNRLSGLAGNDTLNGGAGNDLIDGGTGIDRMLGGTGNDAYLVDNARDVVIEAVNQGTDLVRSSVHHALSANVENLTLTGTAALNGVGNTLANLINGNAGNNRLSGLAGNDTLNGGAGNDLIDGGTGGDFLSGGTGNDRLIGSTGADRMTGGAGADSFIFTALSDSTTVASGRNTIFDFSRAQHDRIDISAIDANTSRAGNQTFSYLGNAAFTGHAGELSARVVTGGTLISGDVNGDRVADFAVLLDDRLTLGADSFIL